MLYRTNFFWLWCTYCVISWSIWPLYDMKFNLAYFFSPQGHIDLLQLMMNAHNAPDADNDPDDVNENDVTKRTSKRSEEMFYIKCILKGPLKEKETSLPDIWTNVVLQVKRWTSWRWCFRVDRERAFRSIATTVSGWVWNDRQHAGLSCTLSRGLSRLSGARCGRDGRNTARQGTRVRVQHSLVG